MSKIDDVLKGLNKEFGKGSIVKGKDFGMADIETIPTGSFSLDRVFGCGGLPRGRIIEVYGAESSGKSTLAMYLVGEAQRNGGKAFWLDAECSFSRKYATNVGVDVDELVLAQPVAGEHGLKMLRKIVEGEVVDVAVIDSVASLVPARELAGEITDAEMAQQARMMSKALRMLTTAIARSKTTVIFINQTREKVGVYFGSKNTTPGGKALKFYSSVRLEVRKGKNLMAGDKDVIGNWMHIKATKNKVGLPFRECDIELYYEKGIDIIGDLMSEAEKVGVISKSGNTFYFNDHKLGVGREKSKAAIETDGLFEKIKDELNNKTNDTKNNKTNESKGTIGEGLQEDSEEDEESGGEE